MNKNNKSNTIYIVILIVIFASLLIWSMIKQFGNGTVGTEQTPGILYIILIVTMIITFFFVRSVYLKLYPPRDVEKVDKKLTKISSIREFEEYVKKDTKIEVYDQNEVLEIENSTHNYINAQYSDEEENTNQTVIYVGAEEQPQEKVVEEQPQQIEQEEIVVEDVIPTEDNESRFYMLTQIDKRFETYKAPKYDNEITLKKLCDDFRLFSAGKLKLYYDIEDIRRFIAGLSVTKLIILQGMSGTGKTSLAYAFGEYLNNKTVVVPIQPMWKERTDLVGYYNEFTKKFNETTLLYKMYEANYNDEIYITVLDEMNIARIEYYFAEFLSLLELPNPEGRNLDVVSDKWDNDPILLKDGKLRLPINMWFIGTANNDDSTFAISDKVYDRAMVLNLDKKAKKFDAPKLEPSKLSSSHLQKLFIEAQDEYSMSDRNSRRIKKLDEYMIEKFHLTFGNRIMKQINSYVPVLVSCGGTELQAIDDILSRKVFRKLESKNPVYVRQQAEGLCAYLDELFGEDQMPLCKEAIHLIEQNV